MIHFIVYFVWFVCLCVIVGLPFFTSTDYCPVWRFKEYKYSAGEPGDWVETLECEPYTKSVI